jgi:uncharacterized LabA/DUF88 family protein
LNTLQNIKSQLNAIGYVDYENILELLKTYGKNPLEIDFFRVILGRLTIAGLKVIDFIVYGNFEKTVSSNDQTFLRSIGLQTRHACNDGKNSGDLELTVDALRDLYKNANISIFVIISSNRDIIPLLKAIKYENKLSYVYSTRNGFNQTIAKYADFHEYLEDIFALTPADQVTINSDEIDSLSSIDPATVSPEKIRRAKEVCQYFYTSHIWTKSSILGVPVTLKGYAGVVAKAVQRPVEETLEDFKLAYSLKYIDLYKESAKGLCIRAGERSEDIKALQAGDVKKEGKMK